MRLGPIMTRQEQMAKDLLALIHEWESYDEGTHAECAQPLRKILASMVGNRYGVMSSSDRNDERSVARDSDSNSKAD